MAVGDSLLHGRRFDEFDFKGETRHPGRAEGLRHAYGAEGLEELNRILGQQYHVVVGNPPYITVKDQGLNQAYRKRFSKTCHQKYSLAVPFTERFFDLAIYGQNAQPAGYVGMITANSFMKREFGKKLIEEFLPRIDLTHVIDTSGAYLPGHGTPTVILFGRHHAPVVREVRAVLGIQGEPGTPEAPAQGKVWRSIVEHLDNDGSQNEFVSVINLPRETLARHPWSIGGGGALELKELIESNAIADIASLADAVGITAVTGEDALFVLGDRDVGTRLQIEMTKPLVKGDLVRDWALTSERAVWLYDSDFRLLNLNELPHTARYSWPFRIAISRRKRFGALIMASATPATRILGRST